MDLKNNNIWLQPECFSIETIFIEDNLINCENALNYPKEIANLIHLQYFNIKIGHMNYNISKFISYIKNNDKLIIFEYADSIIIDESIKFINIQTINILDHNLFVNLPNSLEYLHINILDHHFINLCKYLSSIFFF